MIERSVTALVLALTVVLVMGATACSSTGTDGDGDGDADGDVDGDGDGDGDGGGDGDADTDADTDADADADWDGIVCSPAAVDVTSGSYVVLGYNDLGMHCMNEDFSELMILPPFNTLHAQVIRRGGDPVITTAGVTVSYVIPGNSHSSDKTNFWDYVDALLGVSLAADVGLTGNGLEGELTPTGDNDWSVTGIPITPLTDAGELCPYQLAQVSVRSGDTVVAQTAAVVPVSWEIRCDLCHAGAGGVSPAADILGAHDSRHGTDLMSSRPVLCGECHAQPELGLAGDGELASLSSVMHTSHASRMGGVELAPTCYACHPGPLTQCLRDRHVLAGRTCTDCHDSMEAVGNPARRPWVDEPRCGTCHSRAGFEFEQPGVLFRDSRGHHGVHCAACHGAPHAITPTLQPADDIQAEELQGHAGPIDTCSVCHMETPEEAFTHSLSGGED